MFNLILALFSGAAGSLTVGLIPESKNRLRKLTVLIFAVSSALFSWMLAIDVFAGENIRIACELGRLTFSLEPDPMGAVFGLIASSLWVFAAVYSFGYMEKKKNKRTYFAFLLLSLTMTLGVAFSGNLVVLYLFYELLTFSTYPLVIHERSTEAVKAGRKYILYSLIGAGAILFATVITYSWSGNLEFVGEPVFKGLLRPGLNGLLLLFIAGFGVKAAVIPLHRWLPAAMVAPTPVSALLHAVAVVYSGVFGILRVVYSVFGHEIVGQLSISNILPWIAAFTILAGIIIATRQDVLKRRLAYQTISHLSYILLGAFTLKSWGLAGAVFHMISYSTLKVALFFCAGIISEKTGETNISRMQGVGRSLPKTMFAFSAAIMGMIGMLPLNTFWGKYYLMKGSVEAGKWPLALVLIGSGIINAICFIPVIVNAFRGEREKVSVERGESSLLMLAPTLVLIIISLIIGLVPGLIWPGVEAVVKGFY